MTFTVKTPHFEGPFDLLLYFIERDELDINNIPIASITQDFLNYIHQLEALNIDLASEFILVAATLMRIKAKLLLPRREVDEQGNEIDPREELVQKLLEYKKYKSVLETLRQMEEEASGKVKRGNINQELSELTSKALVDAEMENLSLYKLLQVFEQVMQRYEKPQAKPNHKVFNYPYSIASQQKYILEKIKLVNSPRFEDLFQGLENRVHAITTFLGLLELLNKGELRLIQGEGINNFYLSLPSEEEE
jgi:segregation and condensation protein A